MYLNSEWFFFEKNHSESSKPIEVKKPFFMKNTSFPFLGIFLIFISCHPKETVDDLTINKKKLHITTDTLSESNRKLNYSIEINYPKVNSDSWDHLQKSEFTVFIKDFSKSNKRNLTGNYDILYQDDNLLSMLLETEWAVPGTSRILHYSHPVNWNLKEGVPILGNDYFIKKNSTPRIIALAKEKMPENCDINIKTFDLDFTFCEEGIHLKKLFMFNPPECYDVGAVLEWKEIEDLLTDNGKKFLVNQG
jgi:hypothetical protein